MQKYRVDIGNIVLHMAILPNEFHNHSLRV